MSIQVIQSQVPVFKNLILRCECYIQAKNIAMIKCFIAKHEIYIYVCHVNLFQIWFSIYMYKTEMYFL